MKNVAKCDTWCELQNPGNHRVFERKLRPKPLGRGHVCLGVTHRRPKPTFPRGSYGADVGLPLVAARGWPKFTVLGGGCHDDRWSWPSDTVVRELPGTDPNAFLESAAHATPGQAGLPAEFKHINKRRKRNLPGFP